MLRKVDMYEHYRILFNEFPNGKANGVWDMRKPFVFIRDTDLLKRLAVKEFDHFVDHQQLIDEKMDPIIGNNLIALSGSKWKEMRAHLSPAFTGSKMRQMFQFVLEVTEQLLDYLKDDSKVQSVAIEYNIKDLCAKYTNDLIAICAFGIKVDTLLRDLLLRCIRDFLNCYVHRTQE